MNGKLAGEAAVTGKLPTGPVPFTVGGGAKYHESLVVEDVKAHHGIGTGRTAKGVALSPRTQAWRAYCQALLCSNEFIYVE